MAMAVVNIFVLYRLVHGSNFNFDKEFSQNNWHILFEVGIRIKSNEGTPAEFSINIQDTSCS